MPATGIFTGFGEEPRVNSAQTTGTSLVRVTFNELMSGAGLLDPANYTITEDVGSDAVNVVGVAVDGDAPSASVILTLDAPLTPGTDNYNVLVSGDATDIAGNGVDAAFDNVDFGGTYALPEIPSYCDAALLRLPSQFKESTRLRSLICAFMDQHDDLEQAGVDIETYRSIDTATGVQLDALGDFLGRARNGYDDAQYRLFLRAQVMANASFGHPDSLIEILQLLDNGFAPGSITYTEIGPATSVLHCLVPLGEQPLGEVFISFLRQAKANGTRVILEYEEQGAVLFSWAENALTGDPAPPADSGWDEDGIWAEAVD
jgi:hypothetical protein